MLGENIEKFLSVIIATNGNNEMLKNCLDRVCPCFQSLPEDYYEVLIADRSPDFQTDQIKGKYPWAKFISFPGIMEIETINAVARLAKTDWLVFTEINCIPQDDWMEQIRNFILQNPSEIFQGKVILESEVIKGYSLENIAIKKDLFFSKHGLKATYYYTDLAIEKLISEIEYDAVCEAAVVKRKYKPLFIEENKTRISTVRNFILNNGFVRNERTDFKNYLEAKFISKETSFVKKNYLKFFVIPSLMKALK